MKLKTFSRSGMSLIGSLCASNATGGRRGETLRIELIDSKIVTASGALVDPIRLLPEDVNPEDVAHALSHQCRFTGHTREFYSVAEHSVRVTRWVQGEGGSVEEQKCALLHDASEAYLVDLPKPMKQDSYFGKSFRGAETRAMNAIADRFGLPRALPELVKVADLVLLATEVRDLMPQHRAFEKWKVFEPVPEQIKPWRPLKAREKWNSHFERLFTG